MRLSFLTTFALAPRALAQSASSASASAAAPSSSGSSNSSQYLQQVLGALNQANLTGLASVASGIANTTDGQALLSQLAVGNKTLLAPSNDAISSLPQNVTSNTTLLVQTLAYHILNNTYTVNGTRVLPNHTIARTLLRRDDANVTTHGPTSAANLLVYVIDQVLDLPPSIADVAGQLFPSFAGVINQTGLLEPINTSPGVTVFAPNNAAISNAQSALGQLNGTEITDILANHVINGSVAYSTNLASGGNYTSAGGEPFKLFTNSSGSFVSSANATARIVQSDIIVQNGVVHVIDEVLVDTANNASAAAAAFSSGIAAAATSTEPTAPVTATSSPATSGGSASTSSSSTSKAAAGQVAPISWTNGIVGTVVAVAGVFIGGGFVLV